MTQLVFIHGWGLDPYLWDDICAQLPQYEQKKINLGFFGEADDITASDAILVGHSLGFVHGLTNKRDWRGWIAINSFPRFIAKDDLPGCAAAAELREIKMRLEKNPRQTLQEFHAFIGAARREGRADIPRLASGLDTLRDADIAATARTLPGLVLASRNDPLVPVTVSEALAEGQMLSWHETGGHMLPQNDAKWCAEHITAFVERVAA